MKKVNTELARYTFVGQMHLLVRATPNTRYVVSFFKKGKKNILIISANKNRVGCIAFPTRFNYNKKR